MKDIGSKIKDSRKRKGLSQEELSELAKVNLRTIQRIENNENEPRGKTLNLICDALNLNIEDLLDYKKETNKNFLIMFHLSVLIFLVVPLGNIILPLVLWLTKKDNVIGFKKIGANLLNFQMVWSFVTYAFLIVGACSKILHWNFGVLNSIWFFLYLWLFACSLNIILPIIFAIKISQGKHEKFYPNIIQIIK